MNRIVGIGETVLDVIFRDDKPVAAVPGGSTFNAMISLGRTVPAMLPEARLTMVTEIGDDHVGDIITKFMEDNGVGTESVTRNAGTQSHLSLAFLDERNDAQYEFYKSHEKASLEASRVAEVKFSADDIVLFGSYFAINPKIRQFTLPLLQAARDAGAVLYYDVNFRKNHLDDLPETMASIRENCRLSNFVRGSAEDFGYLFGTTDPQEIYGRHISPLCPTFICTCGAEPVHVFTGREHLTFAVPQVETVSTIGAGDSFNAGFIYGLLRERTGSRYTGKAGASLSREQWQRLVATATRFSSSVCQSLDNYVKIS